MSKGQLIDKLMDQFDFEEDELLSSSKKELKALYKALCEVKIK